MPYEIHYLQSRNLLTLRNYSLFNYANYPDDLGYLFCQTVMIAISVQNKVCRLNSHILHSFTNNFRCQKCHKQLYCTFSRLIVHDLVLFEVNMSMFLFGVHFDI